MPSYRIVCTAQVPASSPPSHAHIVAVGTGPAPRALLRRWTVDEVWRSLDAGDTFYTLGEQSGRFADVEKFICCGRRTLRSAADRVADNNLDRLDRCP